MTQEEFNKRIDDWRNRYAYPERVTVRGAIAFTLRMATTYPELAKEYYNSLPKATQD